MQTIQVATSDGLNRTVEGKTFHNEFRVYRIYGDVTNHESLKEMAQVLSMQLGVERITLSV